MKLNNLARFSVHDVEHRCEIPTMSKNIISFKPEPFFFCRAEEQVKKRLAKEDELRSLKAQLIHVQAEISRNEIKLHDFRGYRRFLESLVPEPQRSERAALVESQRAARQREKRAEREALNAKSG